MYLALLAVLILCVSNQSQAGSEVSQTHLDPVDVGIDAVTAFETIKSVGRVETIKGLGTGWVADRNVVVTDHHVVEDLGIEVLFQPASGGSVPCRVSAISTRLDIAVLFCAELDMPSLNIESTPPKVGDATFTVGYPLGEGPRVEAGYVTALETGALGAPRINLSFVAQPGQSGSPILNGSGDVISVVVGASDTDSVGSRGSEVQALVTQTQNGGSLAGHFVALVLRRSLLFGGIALGLALVSVILSRSGNFLKHLARRAIVMSLVSAIIVCAVTGIEYYVSGSRILFE